MNNLREAEQELLKLCKMLVHFTEAWGLAANALVCVKREIFDLEESLTVPPIHEIQVDPVPAAFEMWHDAEC